MQSDRTAVGVRLPTRTDEHPLAARNLVCLSVLYSAFDAKRRNFVTTRFADRANRRGGPAVVPLRALRPQFVQENLFVTLEWQLDTQPQTRHGLYDNLSGNSRVVR